MKINKNDLNIKIENGNMKELLNWLRDKIHVHGERYDAKVLCQKIIIFTFID